MSEHTLRDSRLRRSLSRLNRLGDIPVVVMLAWAGWLAVPWSFGGLAQARAAAAAAAGPPPPVRPAAPAQAWGIAPPSITPVVVRARAVPLNALPTRPDDAAAQGTARPDDVAAARVDRVMALERARIAGEVHDAAGHGLAAIAMQAGVALVSLDDDPEQARASLRAIRETSVRALTELRAALDRIDGSPDLLGLIDGVRAAGLPVDLEPSRPTTPPHLRGTAYRVVRESLTNVLRHAGPTTALVRVANDPCEFVLEVADRGLGRPGPEGRGLTGLRAHVTEQGGEFTAGPREGGGFRVVARFPQRA